MTNEVVSKNVNKIFALSLNILNHSFKKKHDLHDIFWMLSYLDRHQRQKINLLGAVIHAKLESEINRNKIKS